MERLAASERKQKDGAQTVAQRRLLTLMSQLREVQ
eukprot:gene10442-4027_t